MSGSRKLADVLNLSERLTFEGVRICFVAQGIDSSENQFQLLVSARGMIDQLFLADTSARVHRGMEGLVRKGLHTGGRCYGYRREKAVQDGSVRLVVDEIEASVVRRIFDMFASGHSLKQVARKLNAESVPSPQPQLGRIQRSWAPSAIRQILLNEKYIGNVVWNRRKKVRNPKLQEAVLRPEVVEYALDRFASELGKQMESIDNDQEMLKERKRVLEGEIQQFTAALLLRFAKYSDSPSS